MDDLVGKRIRLTKISGADHMLDRFLNQRGTVTSVEYHRTGAMTWCKVFVTWDNDQIPLEYLSVPPDEYEVVTPPHGYAASS